MKYKIAEITLLLLLMFVSCVERTKNYFMRYEHVNPKELEQSIATDYRKFRELKNKYEQFQLALTLAENLTIAKREHEAISVIEPYIEKQPQELTHEDVAWLYLIYATANQYADDSDSAKTYFEKAVRVCHEYSVESAAHYVYHHYGRFLVEQGNYAVANEYFNKALTLRIRLKDKRIVSTQQAIDSLALIMK
jgi:tetratricopeptide (TPR) repeat protein